MAIASGVKVEKIAGNTDDGIPVKAVSIADRAPPFVPTRRKLRMAFDEED